MKQMFYSKDFTEQVKVLSIQKGIVAFQSSETNNIEHISEKTFTKKYREIGLDVSMYNGVPLPYIRKHQAKYFDGPFFL